jgi:hypothetical protein
LWKFKPMRTVFFPMFSLVKRLRVDLRRSIFLALASLVLFIPLTASATCNGPLRIAAQVSKATVNEAGGDAVTLRLYGSCQAHPGTVTWSVTGSAVEGVDYTASGPTSATTGVNSKGTYNLVTIYPIDNSLRDIGRTITLHISAHTGYVSVGTANATSTIIDDDTPRATVTATDAAAAEAGSDPGTYTISLDRNTGQAETVAYTISGDALLDTDYTLSTATTATGLVTQTSDADFNAGDSSGDTYIFNNSVELASDTLINTHMTQAGTDFSAGDTSGGTSVTGNNSVEILPASSVFNLPDETILQAQNLLGVGGTASDRGLNPLIIQLGSGFYRVYYAWHNGSYWQLAYRDTTDTNPPTSANLGAQTLMGTSTSATDQTAYPSAIETLPGGGYRFYYASFAGGTKWQLAYRDTTDTNLPDETNLGAQVPLGIGGAYHAATPRPQPLPGGGYRLYYSTYAGGSYWQLAYRDTTDTNLPDETNLGTEVLLGVGGTSDHALGSTIYPLPGGGYRYYYSRNAGFWQLAYRDTTDTNLPDTTNLGAEVLLGVGSSTSDQALTVNILQLASGQYRLYYDYRDSTGYWQLAYRDAAGVNIYNTSGSFVSSVMDLSAVLSLSTLDYAVTLPAGTAVTMDVRAGDVLTPDGTWTAWQTGVANGGDISGLGTHQYVQYQVNFSTTDTSVTPKLTSVTVNCLTRYPTASAPGSADGVELTGAETGLQGLWHMNNDWTDASVNGINGTPAGGVDFITPGQLGTQAGNFDGVDDRVSLGTPAALQMTGDQTIMFWVKPTDFSARKNPFAKAYGGEGTITIETNGNVNYYYGTCGGNCTPYQVFTMTNPLTAGEWTHLAIVRDLTNGTLTWYKNGVPVKQVAATYGAAVASTLTAYIGQGYVNRFQGTLDELSVFSRALSMSEIQSSYGLSKEYVSTGSFVSSVLDLHAVQELTTLDYTARIPANTTMSIDVRAGDTSTPDGSWTAWLTDVASGGDLSGLGSHRYVQYQLNMSTTDTSVTPTLADIAVHYNATSTVGNFSMTQTLDADFSAGDTANNVVVGSDSVGLSPTAYYPPTDTTVGAQQLYGVGTSSSDQAFSPYIVALAGGNYRIYYAHKSSFWDLAYRDTTDTNVPSSSNLGAEVLMSIGTSTTNHAMTPFMAALPGGGYRLYYTKNNGSYQALAYRDTTDTNLPDAGNMGAETVLLGTSTSNRAYLGSVFEMPGGTFRLYYAHYNGSYWHTRYVETTDTNPPDTTNIGAPVNVIGTGTSDKTLGGQVVPLSGGTYRFYYPVFNGTGSWQLAYRDTIDTNPPDSGNLGAQVLLGLGGASNNQAYGLQVFKLPNSYYRLSYNYYNGTYWQIAYSDGGAGSTFNSSGVFTSSVMDLGATVVGAATLDYTTTLPLNTTLTVDVRGGDTATPDGSWTAWQTDIASGGDISALGNSRYVQYRANLSTTDTLVTPTLDDVTVNYQANIVAGAGQVVIPIGATSIDVTLTPIDDTPDEYDEVATLTIADVTGFTTPGTPASANVTIADNDLPEVDVAVATNGAEQGGTPGSFTVSRTGIMDLPLTVNYSVSGTATAGADYTALSGTVTIPAASGVGTNSATVSFTPINDALIEGDETVILTISVDAAYVIGAAGADTATLTDNDTDGSSRTDTSGILVQNDWSVTAPADSVSCTSYGGTWTGTSCIGTHGANQSGWTTYDTVGASLDISTPGQVTSVSTPQQWFQTDDSTTDRGFQVAGSSNSGFATVSGFGDDANVTLAPIDVGDGTDGAFNSATYTGLSMPGITGTSPSITINTNEAIHQGVYNFTDFKLAAGDTITVTGGNPLKLYVQIDTKIDGTMIVWAAGGAGGNGPYAGQGVDPLGEGGGGAPDPGCNGCSGGGGGGHATAGSDGTSSDAVTYPPGLGGVAYGDPTVTTLYGGSGGGGNYKWGNCSYPNSVGGHGGGVVLIQSGSSISVAGQVKASGGSGSSRASRSAFGSCGGRGHGAAGGGGGGTIKLVSTNIVLVDGGTRLNTVGGNGGSPYGGAGGGGRIRLEYTNLQGLANANAGTGTITTGTLASNFIAAGSGTYTSHIQYMGSINGSVAAPGVWSTVDWTEELPLGTSMVMWIHSCALNDCSDRGPSDWSALINGQDISSLTFVDDAHAYIQYKVDLDTSGGALPRLDDLTVNTISYGFGVWYQTDDSTAETGFNQAGAVNNSTIVAGSGAGASVYLLGATGGSGVDGDFDSATYDGSSIPGITGTWPNITIDTDEVSHTGSYNFATFTVRTGHIVRVRGSNPLIIKSLGDVVVNGVLNAKGYSGSDSGNNGIAGPGGSDGGAGCATGNGLGAGGAVLTSDSSAGAGGAGHASAGLTGETSYTISGGVGGVTYGDSALAVLEGGSGGGGATVITGGCSRGAYGGGGGGAVQIQTGGSVVVGTVGLISVDGGAGGNVAKNTVYSGGGGGGGGSAGSLEVVADQIILNNPGASLSARGGQGGDSYYFGNGGAGGDGRMRLEANTIQGSASINIGDGSLVTEVLTPSTPINASYTSAIHDAGDPITWDTVNWSGETPTGTTLTVSVHSCALADCSDRGPSDWSLATNAQDISSLAFVNDGDQYIQYRVDMTSDGNLAAKLNDIAINEKLDQGAANRLVSTVYDTEDNSNQIALLDWTADTSGAGTAVKFQLRTSADGVNWGAWYGPTSTTDYYTSPGMAINPVHADGVDDRYFQYRAILISDNAEFAPILTGVRVGYITFGSGAVVVGFGEAFGDGGSSTSSSSSGGGSLGGGFVLILLLGLAFRSRRPLFFWLDDTRLSTLSVLILVGSVPFLLVLASPMASAAVLNFSNANPLPSASYQFFSVGSPGSNFYQEIYIQNFGSFQGGPGSASGGAAGPGGNGTDPLGYGGASYSFTGNGSGNPNRVIIYQVNKSSDMIIDFLKDKFDKKPRIIQSITTSDFSAEFSIDMRAIGYSDNTSDAPIINNQTLVDPFGSATPMTWDMAVDSQAGHTGVDAGKYTYTAGSGPGGSIGTYSYTDGGFDMTALPWYLFFDPNDASNVWTRTTNKPPP